MDCCCSKLDDAEATINLGVAESCMTLLDVKACQLGSTVRLSSHLSIPLVAHRLPICATCGDTCNPIPSRYNIKL